MAILQNHGVFVDMLKTDRVGYVVYEDKFQVVTEPFAGEEQKTGRASQLAPFLTALFFLRSQASSKRSLFITLLHAATKSFANFSLESAHP